MLFLLPGAALADGDRGTHLGSYTDSALAGQRVGGWLGLVFPI